MGIDCTDYYTMLVKYKVNISTKKLCAKSLNQRHFKETSVIKFIISVI